MIDKRIEELWASVRKLYKDYAHLPRTSYWHKPYKSWLSHELYAIKVLKELRERQQFTKKSRKRKLKKDKAIYKQKYLNNTENE